MNVEPPTFVRWVGDDEDRGELVNEAKYRSWADGTEHAVLTLATGAHPMVKGGRDGIRFDVEGEGGGRIIVVEIEGRRIQVVRIEWHTHPSVTGPSDGDREAIRILGQPESWIYEMGGEPDGTRFGPEKNRPGR